jgi:Protein of unknown function (DUF3120)
LSSYTPPSTKKYPDSFPSLGDRVSSLEKWVSQKWLFFAAAAFLVSVPVFFQAPLVRVLPEFSLIVTLGWLWLSFFLRNRPSTHLAGDLLLGFSLTWLAGSIYWGWLRWEPLWHLPIEAIALPFTLVCLYKGWGKVGNWFYLGSLFGTAITDAYFYLMNLLPSWRQVMQVEPDGLQDSLQPIFQNAVLQIQTLEGVGWAIALIAALLIVGGIPLRSQQLHHWVFAGAVLSTLLVDGLFWIVAVSF